MKNRALGKGLNYFIGLFFLSFLVGACCDVHLSEEALDRLTRTHSYKFSLDEFKAVEAEEDDDDFDSGDDPYFIVVTFRSQWQTEGSTEIEVLGYKSESWASGIADGETARIPEFMGTKRFNSVVSYTIDEIRNEGFKPEIFGAVVISMESSAQNLDLSVNWGMADDIAEEVSALLEETVVEFVEESTLDLSDPASTGTLINDLFEAANEMQDAMHPDFWDIVSILIENYFSHDDFVNAHVFAYLGVEDGFPMFSNRNQYTIDKAGDYHYDLEDNPRVFITPQGEFHYEISATLDRLFE